MSKVASEKQYATKCQKSKVEEWLELVNPAPWTRRNYMFSLKLYCEFHGMTPEELIDEADADVRAGVLSRERMMKKRLIAFKIEIAKKGFAANTQYTYMAGIKSFYRAFDHEIPNIGKSARTIPMQEHLDIPSKEDLRDVLKVCDLRDKAIILVGCSSGLTASAIVELTIEQFFKGYDPETHITTLFLRRGKTKTDFVTFLNPEATDAVLAYLEYRNRTLDYTDNKREHQLNKQRWEKVDEKKVKIGKGPRQGSQLLFIKKLVKDEWLETKNEELRKIDLKGFFGAYNEIANRAQKSNGSGYWNLIRSHNMRKFFNSTLKNAGMDSDLVEYMMGHTLGGTKDAYFRADAEGLKKRYSEYMVHLTIQKPLDVSSSHEFQKIVRDNEVLKAEAMRHMVERDEFITLTKELETIKAEIRKEKEESWYRIENGRVVLGPIGLDNCLNYRMLLKDMRLTPDEGKVNSAVEAVVREWIEEQVAAEAAQVQYNRRKQKLEGLF